jgi:hypothetical protein
MRKHPAAPFKIDPPFVKAFKRALKQYGADKMDEAFSSARTEDFLDLIEKQLPSTAVSTGRILAASRCRMRGRHLTIRKSTASDPDVAAISSNYRPMLLPIFPRHAKVAEGEMGCRGATIGRCDGSSWPCSWSMRCRLPD